MHTPCTRRRSTFMPRWIPSCVFSRPAWRNRTTTGRADPSAAVRRRRIRACAHLSPVPKNASVDLRASRTRSTSWSDRSPGPRRRAHRRRSPRRGSRPRRSSRYAADRRTRRVGPRTGAAAGARAPAGTGTGDRPTASSTDATSRRPRTSARSTHRAREVTRPHTSPAGARGRGARLGEGGADALLDGFMKQLVLTARPHPQTEPDGTRASGRGAPKAELRTPQRLDYPLCASSSVASVCWVAAHDARSARLSAVGVPAGAV